MSRPVRAVLFDFSGTLFDDTSVFTGARLAARCAARGLEMTEEAAGTLCTAIQSAIDSPRGRVALRGADRDAETHRTSWIALASSVPGVTADIARDCYACVTDVSAWRPYPDTPPTLRALRQAGIPVAVVSNTGWDISGSFECAGLAGLVDTFVLSCELGVEKPDPLLFTTACQALGVSTADALMVGDDPAKDGGAVDAGIPVHLLPRQRSSERPRGLATVLALAGVRSRPIVEHA